MTRSFCLTKNYCSQECRDADQAVHTVCCKNLLDVDKRKWKGSGKAKAEEAEEALKSHVSQYYQCYPNAQQLDGKHLTEAMYHLPSAHLPPPNLTHLPPLI